VVLGLLTGLTSPGVPAPLAPGLAVSWAGDVPVWGLVLVAVAAIAGGAAQSALGFGAAFTTVPALAIVAPELLPGSVLVALLPLSLVMLLGGLSRTDVRAATRLTLGRLPGIAVGTVVVATLPDRGLAITIGLLLLAAVVASAAGWTVAVNPRSELVAGFASGLTGTAAALGGPPIALLYKERGASVLRPTLALVWAVGLLPIIGSLWLAGEFTADQARAGVLLGVAMLVGLLLAAPLVRRWPDELIRRGVLGWAAVGAVAALGRALVG
jgi:uncharacterized protein